MRCPQRMQLDIYRPIVSLSVMARFDFFIKIEADVSDREKPEKIADEICRRVQKIYGVRKAELTNYVNKDD